MGKRESKGVERKKKGKERGGWERSRLGKERISRRDGKEEREATSESAGRKKKVQVISLVLESVGHVCPGRIGLRLVSGLYTGR